MVKTELDMNEFLSRLNTVQMILLSTLKKIFDGGHIEIYESEYSKEKYFNNL